MVEPCVNMNNFKRVWILVLSHYYWSYMLYIIVFASFPAGNMCMGGFALHNTSVCVCVRVCKCLLMYVNICVCVSMMSYSVHIPCIRIHF